jgi:O-succinylbenzoate synthase
MKALIDFDAAPVFAIPMADGIGVREGMLLEGPQGWGEFSPPRDCDDRTAARWLTAAVEGGTVGWPDPRRGRIPVAAAVPAVEPARAHALVGASGCHTADVDVATSTDSLARDVARVAAVRDALGPDGRIRLHANGIWDLDTAVTAIATLAAAAGELEFVDRPCRDAEETALLRGRVGTRIAADLVATGAFAADVAILRTGPLGGVRRALRLAEQSEVPCVVASTVETSIGLAAGLALAGALPELPFACSLGTTTLLAGDLVVAQRALVPLDGHLPVAPMPAQPDPELMRIHALTDPDDIAWWRGRLTAARAFA